MPLKVAAPNTTDMYHYLCNFAMDLKGKNPQAPAPKVRASNQLLNGRFYRFNEHVLWIFGTGGIVSGTLNTDALGTRLSMADGLGTRLPIALP